jgi:hypothetical protein
LLESLNGQLCMRRILSCYRHSGDVDFAARREVPRK